MSIQAGEPLTRRQRKRAEAEQRLLGAVERMLAEGSHYQDITLDRMVADAGISRTTFYVYFEDKTELLRGWLTIVEGQIIDVAGTWWSLGAGLTREQVRDALARVVHAYQPHARLMSATFDVATQDAALRTRTEGIIAANIAGLRKHIRRGQREGFIDPALPVAETAAWLTWMAERGFHRLLSDASPAELERLIDSYAAIVWKTLYTF